MTPTPEQQRQYQELVEAIVKAVPDICSADTGFIDPRGSGGWRFEYRKNGVVRHSVEVFRTKELAHEAAVKFELYRPHGESDCIRPITLEDVLQTFFEKPIEGQPDWDNAMILIVNKWKFGKSLAEQDESCWKFLHGLLCKE